jgi:hypothetical protein
MKIGRDVECVDIYTLKWPVVRSGKMDINNRSGVSIGMFEMRLPKMVSMTGGKEGVTSG